jgi:hypothetical protein
MLNQPTPGRKCVLIVYDYDYYLTPRKDPVSVTLILINVLGLGTCSEGSLVEI